ncbi:MAG: geranylgeranylglyceryl/heptaprenylglyceryl phosphate synthase [Candidatus Diapherotrites archaeon]|nr:geranylgeranylglyceryl/heptaprenylglyceryl phosphate synthase [Candidatus Diapherotrites archaeon]
MQDGKTYKKILSLIAEKGGLTFMQLDPPNYKSGVVGKIARIAEENGLDAFAVGGSVNAQGKQLNEVLKEIKANSSIPTIIFPGNISTLSKHADAIYFMSMLNSNDPYWITGAQIGAAFPVKQLGIEVIPTSYIIVEPGEAAGWMGRAQLIPRNKPYLGAATALAGQYLGSKLIILESGGGAPQPASKQMVAAVKSVLEVPLLVAGGVRTPKFAFESIKAGADIVQIGAAFESCRGKLPEMGKCFKSMTDAVRKAGKAKK